MRRADGGSAPPTQKARLAAADRRIAAAKRDAHDAASGPGTVAAQRHSAKQTRRWVDTSGYKPRTASTIARTPIKPRPAGHKVDNSVSGILGDLYGGPIGVSRAIVHTAGSIADTVYHQPGEAADKSFKQATEIAKGLPAAAAIIPYSVAYPINKALGNDPSNNGVGVGKGKGGADNPIKLAERMVTGEVKRLTSTYGPSYEGKKGAYGKLRAKVAKEGPLMPALDLATAVGGAGVGLGRAAREGALGERAARLTTTRPDVRMGTVGSAAVVHGRVRPTAVGAATAATHDAARRAAQRSALKRAEKRRRVRVVETVTRRPLDERSLLHADPKPLAPRRAALQEGEVTPIFSARAGRNLRYKVTRRVTGGETAARIRTDRYVTGKDGLQQAARSVPKEIRDVPQIAQQLGIRDAKGARAMIPLRLEEIERSTRAALAGEGKKGVKDQGAATLTPELAVEAARLRELLDHPEVFERADVLAATERAISIKRAAVAGREGAGEEKLAAGRSKLVGETLGVKPARELNAEARAARDADKAAAKEDIKEATREREKVSRTGARVLAGARADLEHAKGRAEVLSRNVTGKERVPGDKEAGRGTSYGAGGHGVRQAERALVKAQERVGEELSAATARVTAAREAHKAANAPLKAVRESSTEYEARVAAASAERGLAAPEHVTSKHTENPDLGFRTLHPRAGTAANELGRKREGTNYRLGHQAHEPEADARQVRSIIERGARIEAEQKVLAEHGLYFADEASANRFMQGLGDKVDRDAIVKITSTGGVVRKDVAERAGQTKGKDHGDYIAAKGVFVVDKVVKDELDALSVHATNPGVVLRRLAMGPQAALLALSPSWFMFQRVNDLMGMVAGGSAHRTVALERVRRELDPDSREIATVMAGGSMSGEILTPRAGQKLGRLQRVMDENPTWRDALHSDKPATNLLLRATKQGPTALLRHDQRITGNVRERQFLLNLRKIAAKMDGDVGKVHRGFAPLGHAFKTGDAELLGKLLKDPKYQKARDEAAESLNRVMGDWHNYTAKEKRVKGAFAFYGFLRYSTRMALYTLPIDHPFVGALVAQLGSMGSEDAKRIIGPDMPYGLGALYNSDGTRAYSLIRANPITGPLTSINKPEQLFGLATPLASIMASYATGQNIGLSDSATGYVKQFTVKGDSTDHGVGGFFSDARLRILGDQVASLLTPYKEWKNWDSKPQSSDSLPLSRRHLQPNTSKELLKLEDKGAAAGPGGVRRAVDDLVPLLGLGDDKNYGAQGAAATAARVDREAKLRLKAAKRAGLRTPLGKANLRLGLPQARIDQSMEAINARLKAADQRIEEHLARKGLAP